MRGFYGTHPGSLTYYNFAWVPHTFEGSDLSWPPPYFAHWLTDITGRNTKVNLPVRRWDERPVDVFEIFERSFLDTRARLAVATILEYAAAERGSVGRSIHRLEIWRSIWRAVIEAAFTHWSWWQVGGKLWQRASEHLFGFLCRRRVLQVDGVVGGRLAACW